MLHATFVSAVLLTLAAPYMAVRFFVLPALGVNAALVLLGSEAIRRDAAWRRPRPSALGCFRISTAAGRSTSQACCQEARLRNSEPCFR